MIITILCISVASCALGVYIEQQVRVSFAHEQISLFWEFSQRAEDALLRSPPDIQGARGVIRAIEVYYPTGTKQRSGTQLDEIVEISRRHSISRITSMLDLVSMNRHGGSGEPEMR